MSSTTADFYGIPTTVREDANRGPDGRITDLVAAAFAVRELERDAIEDVMVGEVPVFRPSRPRPQSGPIETGLGR